MSKFVFYKKIYGSLLIILLLIFSSRNLISQNDNCLSCHNKKNDPVARNYERDIHFSAGISCSDCHGGDPTKKDMKIAKSKENDYKGILFGNETSEICSNCHSDKYEQLKSSIHGSLDVKGDQYIAQCITCHGVHNIRKIDDKNSPVHQLNVINTCAKCHSNISYMKQYNPETPTDQHEKFLTSKHGIQIQKGNINAATCVNCHGSHNVLAVNDVKSSVYPEKLPETCSKCHQDQYKSYVESLHGIALLKKGDAGAPACNDCHGNHGATPPGIESISKVCGLCHAINADLFSKSPHKKAFDKLNLPECETCHGYHKIIAGTEQLIGITNSAVCVKCHSEENNPEGFLAAKHMRTTLDSLVLLEMRTSSLVSEAEQKGMVVSEPKYRLRDIRQIKLETRTIIHAFSVSKFNESAQKGFELIVDVKNQAQKAIDEYYFRRWGLLASTLIISVLAIGLFFYIKEIEKK